ncbi:hypothetical protein BKA56DRAFT_653641 [Ilyonectria sp. MPI-CAGE-AT-0026]|nr:hypothetical protein BKA56DRAFT_653641 [Ilyonectria sp. MPI-CAGE-AT-0026]
MARLVALATWALSLASVHATQPTSGWQVDVAASEVYISWDSDSSDGGLIVEFPVNITRIIATANSFALTISTTPYLFNSTTAGEETSEADVIYTQNIDVPPADQFSQAVYIHMAEPQQDVLISLGLDDGSADSAFITVNSTGFVIARDAEQQGSWAARVIADYDHQVNLAITEYFNNAMSNGIDEADPRDLGKAPVVHRNEVKPVDKNSDGESWTITTPGGYTSTSTTDSSTSTTSPDGGSAPPDDTYVSTAIPGDDYSPPDGYTYTGTTGDEVTTTVSGGCGRGGAHTIIITRYRTVSTINTSLFGKLQTDRHTSEARGDEKIGSKGASATTDANGFAVFRFDIGDGQRVEATRIFTFLFTEWFYIGSRKLDTEQLTPKVLQLDLNPVKWSVNAGEIVGAEAYYGFSEYNQGLAVADAFTTLTEFVRTQVATGENEMEKVNVWFPGAADSGAYFASYGDPPYINLPQLDAANPSVMAHEYGHWLHWIARKRGELRAGGWHQFCGDGIDKKVTTAFSEGYATAFGLFAIDQTPLVDAFSPYMEYQKRQYAPKKSWSQNIEAFNCGDSFMLRQEGRIAAALFDLVDRKLDEFPTSSNNLGRISDGFDPQKLNWMWSPRFIFWLLMQDNPQNIEEYWRKFQKYPDQTTEWEDRAWSIFDYNYADFPQHVGSS